MEKETFVSEIWIPQIIFQHDYLYNIGSVQVIVTGHILEFITDRLMYRINPCCCHMPSILTLKCENVCWKYLIYIQL